MEKIRMPLIQTKQDLAKTILGMNYGTLLDVGRAMASMKDADARPKIETPEEYASMLFDWAESNEDE